MINRYIYIIFIFTSILCCKGVKILFNNDSVISYTGSHPAHDWTGVSQGFRGGIICKNDLLQECVIKIAVPLKSFDSNNSGRDSNMLLATESNKYPFVKFVSKRFNLLDSLDQKFDLSGILEFHGVKNNIIIDIEISRDQESMLGLADFSLLLSDYKVSRPELLFTPISDKINISCKLLCDNKLFFKEDEK